MGVGNLSYIAERLIENERLQSTPAAVIADATLPTQRVVKAPLGRISEKCEVEKIEPPAIIVVGAVADSDARLGWFMRKPLFGRSIVVTRDARGNADFAAKVVQQGGNPIEFATIKIKPLTLTDQFLRTLAKFAEYDWIIFTSGNGVTIFFEALQSLSKDARVFASAKIAAIGSETAAKLTQFGINADFVPSVFTGKELANELITYTNLSGRKILLLRSQLASKELVELLTQAGAEVQDVAVYTAVEQKGRSAWLTEKINDSRIDWLTFASPSSARVFFEQIRGEVVNSSDVKVASIGPVTSEQLKNLGIRIDITAIEHTIDGLIAAIEETHK